MKTWFTNNQFKDNKGDTYLYKFWLSVLFLKRYYQNIKNTKNVGGYVLKQIATAIIKTNIW